MLQVWGGGIFCQGLQAGEEEWWEWERGEEREGDRSRGEGSMVAYVPDESLKENLYKH